MRAALLLTQQLTATTSTGKGVYTTGRFKGEGRNGKGPKRAEVCGVFTRGKFGDEART